MGVTIGDLLDQVEQGIKSVAAERGYDATVLKILLLNHRKFCLMLIQDSAGQSLSELTPLDEVAEMPGYEAFEKISFLHGKSMALTLRDGRSRRSGRVDR